MGPLKEQNLGNAVGETKLGCGRKLPAEGTRGEGTRGEGAQRFPGLSLACFLFLSLN